MKKFLKVLLAVAFVAALATGAWFVIGMNKPNAQASSYYGCYSYVRFDNTNLGWDEVYAYMWNDKDEVTVIELEEAETNTFGCNIEGFKYNKMLFKNTPGKDNWDKQTIDLDSPTGPATYTFIPTNTNGKIEGTIKEGAGSVITVYYANDAIETPHMYFKVGDGKWSTDYGTEMIASKARSVYHELKVFVPNNDSVTCCFNNGDDSVAWDNNNTKDYKLDVVNRYTTYTIDNGEVSFY